MKPRELADRICRTLRANGHQAFLAGGCVRDLLLGREPADFDVATDAVPARVQELFPNSNAVGARFGVILVVDEGTHTEVATFRSDVSYSDGRHPDAVIYARTPQEDVQRRDFTINGLLIDPQTEKVLDYVGGRADLEAKVIRAIGEPSRRFAEDKLRMMRAVRFAARLGYAIEPATAHAVREHAREITEVSAERLRDELTKILTEGAARRGFELLDELGLLARVLPEVTRMRGVEQPPQFHPEGDVWIHTRLMLEGLAPGCSPTLAWGVLFHDVGKPPTFAPPAGPGGRIRFDGHVEVGARMAEEICRRLRFSNEEIEQIVLLVENHLRFKDALEMRPATLKRFVRLPRFEEHLELHRLDCLSSHRNLEAYEYVSHFLKETPAEEVRPPRILTGDDLRGLGFTPGPVYKEILQAVEDAQLENRLKSHQDALEFVRMNFKAASLEGPKR
ncbi:MAG TPA: CCA tRNA nucleotidyltransferase [Candidatus Acidoferrales bacterium]|nr:CCA tRNA nucleotidyltransferase [Candidatus Acidoferrales bacterium]